MREEDRRALRARLLTFDEAGLVALANKGLVRRASRDLERDELRCEETGDAVLVHGPDWTVTMPPAGPAEATDTTRASGVTRQILAATMMLRDGWAADLSPGAEDPAPGETVDTGRPGELRQDGSALRAALVEVDPAVVEKWAGVDATAHARRLLRADPERVVEEGVVLVVRFPEHEVEVRWIPGDWGRAAAAPLEAAHSTAPRRAHPMWVAAAALGLRSDAGREDRRASDVAPDAPSGAVRARAEVVRVVVDLLEGFVATGIAHPAERWAVQLATLAPSATAVHLPRVDRELAGLADEVELALTRHVRADASRFLDRLARTRELAVRIGESARSDGPGVPIELAGRHRGRYEPVGSLDLAGVGAVPWRTGSGYEGTTVYFWDAVEERFLTWSWTRPRDGRGPTPEDAFRGERVWAGAPASEELCRRRVRLEDARVHPEGRLSSSSNTRAEAGGPTDPAELEASLRRAGRWIDDWEALGPFAAGLLPAGLRVPGPLESLAVLAPAEWGERRFDELGQRFVQEVADAAGRTVALTVEWIGTRETSVAFLERVSAEKERVRAVLVRVGVADRLTLEPLAFWCGDRGEGRARILCPAFDAARLDRPTSALLRRLRKKYGRDRIATSMDDSPSEDPGADDGFRHEDASDDDGAPSGLPRSVGTTLLRSRDLLLAAAEAGVRGPDPARDERLRAAASRSEGLGLATLGAALRRVAEDPRPGRLLEAAWAARVTTQATRKWWWAPRPGSRPVPGRRERSGRRESGSGRE